MTTNSSATTHFRNKVKQFSILTRVICDVVDCLKATLTMAAGEPVLEQMRARHRHQMERRPEVSPGDFKLKLNRAGNTAFVHPDLVRRTLIEGSKLLASVPAGTA